MAADDREQRGPSRVDSLRSRIGAEIRDRIQRGEIGADERLVDVEIAGRLGVSRMPVREALLQLTHEGYLVGTTRGFMLPRLTPADVADIFEVRRLLEPRAAAHAARDLDEGGISALAAAVADADHAVSGGDADLLFAANVAFRAGWLKAVSNARLAATIARFADHVQVVRLATLRDAPTQPLVADGLHRLYEAFAAHDSVAAFDRMATFIDTAEKRFLALTGSGAVPEATPAAGRTAKPA